MKSTVICTVCPVSCPVDVEWTHEDGVLRMEHQRCKLAREFVQGELFDPRRTVTSSIEVDGGDMPLVSVKSDRAIPKDLVLTAMDAISGLRVQAPVRRGDVLLEDIAGVGAQLLATRDVRERPLS